jgi:hypothetical protein
MAKLTVFAAANQLEEGHPFILISCLVQHNQTVDPDLTIDEALLPLAARWLDRGIKGAAPTAELEPEQEEVNLSERVRALSRILRRLKNNGYFGGRHTQEANFQTGVPGHLVGFAKDAKERLLRLGILNDKDTTSGHHIWLNERRLRDIDNLIAGRVEDQELRDLCGL